MQLPVLKTQPVLNDIGEANHAARRIIVLVPPGKFDEEALSMQIQAMAEAARIPILWLALASDPEEDYEMRLILKYLQTVVSSIRVMSEYRLSYRPNWFEAIYEIWRDGDRIVCLDGHMVGGKRFARQPLAQQLAADKNLTIEVIQGLNLEESRGRRNFWREVLIWALSISVIMLFFYIQIYIDQNTPNILGKIVIFLSILIELGLIAKIAAWW